MQKKNYIINKDSHLFFKYIREIQGRSQKEFGSLIGISQSKISKIESGKIHPTIENILALCDVFNITVKLTGL